MAQARLSQETIQEAIHALEAAGGNKRLAAQRLGISEGTFKSRLVSAQQLGITIPDVSPLKVQALERELRDLRNEHRRLQEDHWTVERVKQLIQDGRKPAAPPTWLLPKSRQANLTGVCHLLASDWHWDEVVDPRQINGVNAFNREIAVRRCEHLFKKFIELYTQHMDRPRYDHCELMLDGDLLSGNIHDELAETNEYPIALSMLSVTDHLIAGITLLLNAFKKVSIRGVVGNHGRWHKKMRAKNRAFENYEWLVLQMLARHFRGETGLHFDIADGADLPFQIYGTKYLMNHGDQAKGGSGIAGALSPLMLMDARKRKRAMATKQDYDYQVLGHWHQLLQFKGLIVNGSLKGYDEWTASMNFEWELPTQAAWVTHPDHGITVRWPVYLEKQGATFS